MELSNRIQSVAASATIAVTRRVSQMKAAGEDVVAFAAGEPDFDTPQFIKDAAKAALDAGDTKYTARGAEKLKQAVADKLARENGLTVVMVSHEESLVREFAHDVIRLHDGKVQDAEGGR